jgi:hypothetical protein
VIGEWWFWKGVEGYGKKNETIPVRGRGDPQGCDTSRLPHFLDKSTHRWRWDCQPYSPTGYPLPPGRFLVLISVRSWVDPRVIVRLEELGQLKNPVTSSRIEPATFRLVEKSVGNICGDGRRKNQGSPQSRWPVCLLKFEPGIFGMRSRNHTPSVLRVLADTNPIPFWHWLARWSFSDTLNSVCRVFRDSLTQSVTTWLINWKGREGPFWPNLRCGPEFAWRRKIKNVVPVLDSLSTMPWRYMGSGGIAPPFYPSALDGDERSRLLPGLLIFGERAPHSLCRRLGGPTSTGLDAVE